MRKGRSPRNLGTLQGGSPLPPLPRAPMIRSPAHFERLPGSRAAKESHRGARGPRGPRPLSGVASARIPFLQSPPSAGTPAGKAWGKCELGGLNGGTWRTGGPWIHREDWGSRAGDLSGPVAPTVLTAPGDLSRRWAALPSPFHLHHPERAHLLSQLSDLQRCVQNASRTAIWFSENAFLFNLPSSSPEPHPRPATPFFLPPPQ